MQKDLHEKPFDEGTLKKLDIFEAYTKQWLPTFIMNNFESDIYIFGNVQKITSAENLRSRASDEIVPFREFIIKDDTSALL